MLLYDYMERMVCADGNYINITRGISFGCPLSPLMGAIYLNDLDTRMDESGHTYIRFMDDWVVLAPTRWKLRKAIRTVNETLRELRVEQHPDKTYIGRIANGFDFLGFHLSQAADPSASPAKPNHAPIQVSLSAKIISNFLHRMARLYEQDAGQDRIALYVRHWLRWVCTTRPA